MSTPKSRRGQYVRCSAASEPYNAFIPPPLPPEPPINLNVLEGLLSRASKALGQLDAASEILPNSSVLLYYFVRKEAVLSSQIEGTQSSLTEFLQFESGDTPGIPTHDIEDVSSCVAAFSHGLSRLKQGFPLSLRLIREIHKILLAKGRGMNKQPGEFRTSQNWIGGSRPGNAAFVPPPPDRLVECLDAFEKYLHSETSPYSPLINAGLLHVQFESIHPFLDGNGRIGRLLITFYLMMKGELSHPNLYLSLFFKNNHQEYYNRLSAVRKSGDWEGWLDFFLHGVIETATAVVNTSLKITALFRENEARISSLKRASSTAAQAHLQLQKVAIVSALKLSAAIGVSVPTARLALKNLTQLGIVKELKGYRKERVYVYSDLITALES